MRKMIYLAFVLVLMAAPALAQIKTPVKVTGGAIAGVSGKDPSIIAFKGIPFAAPPVGKLRWREPQPVVSWQGIRKADKFGASCIQNIVTERKPWTYEFMAHNEVSEDCLSLNVWTGAKSVAERRPVFVYFYGGGLSEGSTRVPVYDGEGLAKKGLVMVTVNYRLGALGWIAHPELSKESGHNASGNYGLLDQVAALKWIHENITRFGGDPSRVTIAGQSAGSRSVHFLTGTPLAKGLFHRAIAESGSSIEGNMGRGVNGRKLADAEADGAKFGAAKGAMSISAMRALSWQKILETIPGMSGPGGGFGPVIDGYAFPAPVMETFAQGKQNDVPEITGCNKDEDGAEPDPTITLKQYQDNALKQYGELAGQFLELYPAADDVQARAAQNESARDRARIAMYLWARARAKTAGSNAYTYFWDHALPGPDAGKFGAFHTSEVPYVLNTLYMSDRPFTDADRKIADMMSSYWANFAATGNPNGKGLAVWREVSEKHETMELGDKTETIPLAGSQGKFEFFQMFFANRAAQ
jgi:para-nitrobenzyl esterase